MLERTFANLMWQGHAQSDGVLSGPLAADHGEEKTAMIDATHLKAHRTASSLGVKKGGVVA